MSVNSLQGVRGLLTLSNEKKEDGLTTPKHRSKGDDEVEEDEDDLSAEEQPGTESAGGSTSVAEAEALSGAGEKAVENENRHLGLAYTQPQLVFTEHTDVLSGLESSLPLPDPVPTASDSAKTAEQLLAVQTAQLNEQVSSTIADTQKWRAEQSSKLQQQLREMNRAHRRGIQAQYQAAIEADLALFDQTADDSSTPKRSQTGSTDHHRATPEPETEQPVETVPVEKDLETASLQLELQQLRQRADALRAETQEPAAIVKPVQDQSATLARLLNKDTVGVRESLIANENLVSKAGKVFTESAEDRMDHLELVNKLASMEMATADDEQVRQRQNAAFEDAVAEIDKTNDMGEVQGELENYGDALSDILARLSALDSKP